VQRGGARPSGAELASARDGRRASARLVLAHGGRFGLQWLCTFARNPCSGLAGAGDGDGHGRHILCWKHHREVCALLRMRPRLRRETSDPELGDGGAAVSLPCWGHRLGVARGQGLGEDGGCRLLCEVQLYSLARMMTRAEDGSRRDFVSRFTWRVRWILLLCRATMESEVRCLCGDDDRPRVVCSVLRRRKTCIIPL
jgi:hypothetical protein